MFNISNCTSGKNDIFLYDERTAGKDGNAVCSLRWRYHTSLILDLIRNGKETPTMAIKVMDNCVGQNKSQTTHMFDCLLSILLYNRVADFYLLPGHSHMKPDQVTANCKKPLNRKDLFVPHQVAEEMCSVQNMTARVITSDDRVFVDWDTFLKKHLKKLPGGFTANYCFEFSEGQVIYKRLVDDPDYNVHHHFIPQANLATTRRAILYELLGLPAEASLEEIARANVRLPYAAEKPLTASKSKSLARKLPYIPEEYRWYYPAPDNGGLQQDDEAVAPGPPREAEPAAGVIDAQLPTPGSTRKRQVQVPLDVDAGTGIGVGAQKRRRPPGRPAHQQPAAAAGGDRSILQFALAKPRGNSDN